MMYQERLSTMCQWFDQWDESGQMVALIKMLTRIVPTQARFVVIALENSLTNCSEVALKEQEANNAGFISNLLNESKDRAMEELLHHVPLLRPANKDAKHAYLAVMPVLINHCLEQGKMLDKVQQLLVYIHIHPALKEDRRMFDHWSKALVKKITSAGSTPLVANVDGSDQTQGKVRRSNSLTPPFAVTPSNEIWTSQDDLSVVRKSSTSRRFSLSLCEGPPLSPQSSQASSGSGSETHLDDLRPGYEAAGMQDVKPWLKSLRLHKYSRLFSQLTYHQMLNLTEENFDATVELVGAGPVTTGAQRKILLSISKLRERSPQLRRLAQEITEGDGKNLTLAMDQIKAVLQTPLKPYEESDQPPVDDLPTEITTILCKVGLLLMVYERDVNNMDGLNTYIILLDTALRLEAFSPHQRKLNSSRHQISQHVVLIKQSHQPHGYLAVPPARFVVPRLLPATNSPLRHHSPHTQSFLAKRPSLQDSPGHPNPWPPASEFGAGEEPGHSYVQRTHSAPPNPPPDAPADNPADADPELTSRLESLCLRMTEQSLEL